jgi:hypothetical protein
MENSAKAMIEIERNNNDIARLNREIETLNKEADNASSYDVKKLIYHQINKLRNKIYTHENKIESIKKLNISTSEMTKLKKELYDFHVLERERSLGTTSLTVVGNSKVIGPCKVGYTKYSSFMSNVRGCGSLANTTSIHTIEKITKEQLDELIKTNGKSTTAFFGGSQTETLNNAVSV